MIEHRPGAARGLSQRVELDHEVIAGHVEHARQLHNEALYALLAALGRRVSAWRARFTMPAAGTRPARS